MTGEPSSDGIGLGERPGSSPNPGDHCPNCGTRRPGRFCSRCGQNDRDYARSLVPVVREVLRETFELDSRVFRTLKLMALRPGELPAEFSRNRRASYASPVRLYLFTSLFFFFVLSVTETMSTGGAWFGLQIEQDREAANPRSEETGGDSAADQDGPGRDSVPVFNASPSDIEAMKAALPPEQRRKVDEITARPAGIWEADLIHVMAAAAGDSDDFAAELTGLTRLLYIRLIDAAHNPQLAGERLLNALPIAMFFMLPVYAILLAGFYFRKRRFFAEHLVFGMHVHAVAFVVFALVLLVQAAPDNVVTDWTVILLRVVLAVHYYLALKRYYRDGWMRTAVKGGVLSKVYSVLLLSGLGLAAVVALGLE